VGSCCGKKGLEKGVTATVPDARESSEATVMVGCASGSSAAAPRIQVVPMNHDFGNVIVGHWSRSVEFAVTNVGDAPLLVGALAVSPEFQLRNGRDEVSNQTLAPGEHATVRVRHRPAAMGARAGTLTIPSNCPLVPGLLVNLSATGVAPHIDVVNALPFGRLGLNATDTRQIHVRNTGTAPLTVQVPVIGGANAGHFGIAPASVTMVVIAPNGQSPLELEFRPTAVGNHVATVTLLSDDPNQPARVVTLTGESVPRLVRLHLDEDRDGRVDATPADCANFLWGATARGAIVLVKCGYPVTAGGLPDANAVVVERREMILRWTGPVPANTVGWTAVLNIDRPDLLKVFGNNRHGPSFPPQQGAAPMADAHGDIDLTAVLSNNPSVSLFLEVASFALGAGGAYSAAEADWRFNLTFTFTDQGAQVNQQVAQVRVAPWLMASDLEPTEYVAFKDYPAHPNVAANPVFTARIPNALRARLPAGCIEQMASTASNNPKAFARDVQKAGFVSSPGAGLVVLVRDLDNQSPIASLTNRMLSAHQALRAYRTQAPGIELGAQSGGGNLLASPPMPGHPFGRMIYGHSVGRPCELEDFLAAQRYQTPIQLDSSWLHVGHVDEYLAFLPDATRANGWDHKILVASARLGHALCHVAAANPDANPTVHAAQAIQLSEAARAAHQLLVPDMTLAGTFGALPPPPGAAGPIAKAAGYAANPAVPAGSNGWFVCWSDGANYSRAPASDYLADEGPGRDWLTCANIAQAAIDADRDRLVAALGIGHDQFVEIPVVFGREGGRPAAGLVGHSADSVNMLVLTNAGVVCIVPKPFGPVANGTYLFEHAIATQLAAFGAPTLHFVNDWADLHAHDGEIHCGTNQVPFMRVQRWWHQQP